MIGILFVLHSFAYSTTFFVDQNANNASDGNSCESLQEPCITIQGAVGKASEVFTSTDNIIVSPGAYNENIVIEKNITLESSHGADITIINSIATIDSIFGSVILIRPESNSTHQPLVTIDGFTIQGGIGTSINEIDDDGVLVETRMGGGIFAFVCSPIIKNCIIKENTLPSNSIRRKRPKKGCGIKAKGDSEDMDFPTLSSREEYIINGDLAPATGPLNWNNNTFENNIGALGSSVHVEGSGFVGANRAVRLRGSHFDVAYIDSLNPESNGVPEYWVKGSPGVLFDYHNEESPEDTITYDHPAITLSNVFVDNQQDNENTDDCGTQNNKCQTLSHTLRRVYSINRELITIHLSEGSYDVANGETFPLQIHSNYHIEGTDRAGTVIDAKEIDGVLTLNDADNVSIRNLSLKNGENYRGGGVNVKNSTLEIVDVNIYGNDSGRGGGIYCVDNSNVTATNVNIESNDSNNKGGGIYCNNSTLILDGGSIQYNSDASPSGAGIYCDNNSTARISGTHINNNIESSGLYFHNSTPILSEITVEDNGRHGIEMINLPLPIEPTITASDPDFSVISGNSLHGIHCTDSDPIIYNVQIDNNKEGGMYLYDSDAQINNSDIINHDNDIYAGGGIHCTENSKADLSEVFISNNHAETGGGIFLYESDVTLENVTITNNKSEQEGAGIYIYDSSPNILGGIISNNVTNDGSGAGVYISGESVPKFTDLIVSDNYAEDGKGGGIYISNSYVELTRVVISDNQSDELGGAIFCSDSEIRLLNNTITNNEDVDGAGIYLSDDCYLEILNSIVYNNVPKELYVCVAENNNDDADCDGNSTVVIQFSNVMGYEVLLQELFLSGSIGGTQVGNIANSPEFVDLNPNGDYHLVEGSPCIDAGSTNPYNVDDIDEDLYSDGDGDCVALPDMGAYEYLVCTAGDLGDINDDGSYNVLDIVVLANCVLVGDCADNLSSCVADINQDCSYNVLDIVVLANCVLADNCDGLGRSDDASHSQLILIDNILSIEADGFIGGVQMTLKHGNDFSIKMTEMALHADYLTEGNETRLLVITPETAALFSYSGDFEITEIIVANSHAEIAVDLPLVASFSLDEAYPNPFNPTTTLNFTLPKEVEISLKVYNLKGREVVSLVNGNMDAGYHSVVWNADTHASGIYFVKMIAGEFVSSQKLMLVK